MATQLSTPTPLATASPSSINATSFPTIVTPTPAPTPISLDNVTTPFIPPSECIPLPSMKWSMITVHVTESGLNSTTTYPNYLLPNLDDKQFSACQPSGWDSVAPRSRFTYSPAVCPSGWGYYSLSDYRTPDVSDTATVTSTARCCPSGFSFLNNIFLGTSTFIPGPYCISTPTQQILLEGRETGQETRQETRQEPGQETSIAATNANATTTHPPVTRLYPPWNIIWEQRDAKTLSPEPPELNVAMAVPTWEPGTQISDQYKRRTADGGSFGHNLIKGIIAIVLGTVGGIFVAGAVSFFVIRRNTRRKRLMRQAFELQERYDSSRRDYVPDEPLPIYPSQGTHDNTVHIAGHQPGGQSRLPPYKERASEDSSDNNHAGGDDRRENISQEHARQASSASAASWFNNRRGNIGTTRQQQTNDDITAQRD